MGSIGHLGLAALLLAGAAAAKTPSPPPGPPPPVHFFISPMGEPFRAKATGEDPVAAWFGQADRDGNGNLSLTEFQADADRFFLTLDTDHDGELGPDEVIRYEHDIAPEIQLGQGLGDRRGRFGRGGYGRREGGDKRGRHGRPGDREADGLEGAGRFSWLNYPEPVAAADADLNRGVSRREFAQAAADRFQMLDADKDGALTLAELPRLPEQRSEEERKRDRKTPRRVEGVPLPPED